jgi:hypothetical protein
MHYLMPVDAAGADQGTSNTADKLPGCVASTKQHTPASMLWHSGHSASSLTLTQTWMPFRLLSSLILPVSDFLSSSFALLALLVFARPVKPVQPNLGLTKAGFELLLPYHTHVLIA